MIKHQKGDINVGNLDKRANTKTILQMQNLRWSFGVKLIVEFLKSFWKYWGKMVLRLLINWPEHT